MVAGEGRGRTAPGGGPECSLSTPQRRRCEAPVRPCGRAGRARRLAGLAQVVAHPLQQGHERTALLGVQARQGQVRQFADDALVARAQGATFGRQGDEALARVVRRLAPRDVAHGLQLAHQGGDRGLVAPDGGGDLGHGHVAVLEQPAEDARMGRAETLQALVRQLPEHVFVGPAPDGRDHAHHCGMDHAGMIV